MPKRGGLTNAQKLAMFPALERDRNRFDLMVHDLINERVIYGEWFQEADSAGAIRVGISRMSTYGICIVIWRYPGQRDSVQVYDLDAWKENLRGLRNASDTWEANVQALASAERAAPMQSE